MHCGRFLKLSVLVVLMSVPVAVSNAAERRPARRGELTTEHPPTTDMEVNVAPEHPRLVFRPEGHEGWGRTFEEVRELYRTDETFQSIFQEALNIELGSGWQHPAMLAAVWVVNGDERYAEAAINRMVRQPGRRRSWSHALAYDWLYHYPGFTDAQKERTVAGIIARLHAELAELDATSHAVWHGRNQTANVAMITALGIAEHLDQETLQRVTAHYIDSLRALEYTEGWPEGPSYWIYNRAGPYAIAADAVMTALGIDEIDGIDIREVMRKVGLWSIYQYAPNGVFEPYGDSAGSLRLGHTGWWTVTVDYFARLSRDPAVMAGGDFFRNRSPRPYGRRPYYWHIVLTYDPAVRPQEDYDPKQPERWMRENLPQAMLFGRDSMATAFLRGEWGDPDELYASFKASDMLAHHDHYDVGHFSIQKGGVLAPRTGIYSVGYWSDHRLGYAVQTVAANSLLVLQPGESSAFLRSRTYEGERIWSAVSGGQRVISPTGFTCYNFQHYLDQKHAGPHLGRASVTAWESRPAAYDYIAADITSAYNSTRWSEPGAEAKVSLVTRQFIYLRREKAFVVYDRVHTTDPSYLPKFLLHHLSKPETPTERLLAGESFDNGILEAGERVLVSHHDRGELVHHALLPAQGRALKIGGPDYQCYVETDGDQSNGFTGDNLIPDQRYRPQAMRTITHVGFWRTETEPTEPRDENRFLNVLVPRLTGQRDQLPKVELVSAGDGVHAVRVGDTVVVFAHEAEPAERFDIQGAGGSRCILVDAVPDGLYRVGARELTASPEGVLEIDTLPEGRTTVQRVDR